MAKTRRKSGGNSGGNSGVALDGDILDVTESVRDELPAELVRKIAQYYGQLRGVKIKSERNGSWRLLKNRLHLGTPPSDMTVDQIALKVCGMVLEDVDTHGPANNYHAVLECQIGDTDSTTDKYAPLKALIDAEGDLAVYDHTERGEGPFGDDSLAANLEPFVDLAIRSLGAVVEATEGYSGLAGGLEKVLSAVTDNMQKMAETSSTQTEMELRIAEIGLRGDALGYDHKERMDRNSKIGEFLMELAGPIGGMVEDFVQGNWDLSGVGSPANDAPDGATGSGSGSGRAPKPSRLAKDFTSFLEGLNPQQFEAYKGIYQGDEWVCQLESKTAESDAAFGALFTKVGDLFVARQYKQEQFQKDVIAAIGMKHGLKLQRIWKKLAQMGL